LHGLGATVFLLGATITVYPALAALQRWEPGPPRSPEACGGLGISNLYADLALRFGKAITLNAGFGPQCGKGPPKFVAWVISWVILHVTLRKREANLKR